MKRRDFLQGTALAVAAGTTLSPTESLALQSKSRDPAAPFNAYPPALTVLRGSHPGSFEISDEPAWNGRSWPQPDTQSGDTYDLIVVAAGISGIPAAYFYRQRIGEDARILLLDNHDDFGGHAWSRGAGPHVIGRQQIGRIAIANSDSEQYAYVNGAVDAASRAVRTRDVPHATPSR